MKIGLTKNNYFDDAYEKFRGDGKPVIKKYKPGIPKPVVQVSDFPPRSSSPRLRIWLNHDKSSGRLELTMKDKDILQSKELKINDIIIDCYCSMMSIHARSKGKEFTFQSVCCPEKHKCVNLFVQFILKVGRGGGHFDKCPK